MIVRALWHPPSSSLLPAGLSLWTVPFLWDSYSHNSVSHSKNILFPLSQLFSNGLTLSPSPLSLSVFFFRVSLPFSFSVMHQKSLTFVTRVVPETPPTRGPRWNISFLIQLLSAPFRLLSMATVAERASGRQVSSEAQPCLRQMSSPKKKGIKKETLLERRAVIVLRLYAFF